MPRKASRSSGMRPIPSLSIVNTATRVYRDSLGRFATRGKVAVIFVERDAKGRYISGIEKFLRERGGYSEAMIARIKEHRGISKQLRMKWDNMGDKGQPNKYATRIKYKGKWYSREAFDDMRKRRIDEIKKDYYQKVAGLSKREASRLLRYIKSGRTDNAYLNALKARVGSDPRKKRR